MATESNKTINLWEVEGYHFHKPEDLTVLVGKIYTLCPGLGEEAKASILQICKDITGLGFDDGQQYVWWMRAGGPFKGREKEFMLKVNPPSEERSKIYETTVGKGGEVITESRAGENRN
jgi:hypothetical protein